MRAPILPVILCGGNGTRLAPLSTPDCPKPFVELFQDHPRSLFQRTLLRIPRGADVLLPVIVGNIQHRDLIRDQVADAGVSNATVFLEPINRNTAPAIAIAAHWAALQAPEAILAVLPSDHVVEDDAKFCNDIQNAGEIAVEGMIAVFGIKPDRPDTGYGYIAPGEKFAGSNIPAFSVENFLEKPDLPTAHRYFADGTRFWNSGMFVFRPETMLGEFQRFAPNIGNGSLAALQNVVVEDRQIILPKADYEKLDAISLDYAIMEKTIHVAVLPFSSPWWDLGTLDALRAYSNSPYSNANPLSTKVHAFLENAG